MPAWATNEQTVLLLSRLFRRALVSTEGVRRWRFELHVETMYLARTRWCLFRAIATLIYVKV